jgi:hypothetical protein
LILGQSDDLVTEADDIRNKLTSFITILLDTKVGLGAVNIISLDFDMVPSSFFLYESNILDTGLSIKLDGNVYYSNAAPSRDELMEHIIRYFSSGGIQELEEFLIGFYESAEIAEFFIDGTLILIRNSNGEEKVIDLTKQEKSNMKKERRLTGIIVATVILILICSTYYWRKRSNSNGFEELSKTVSGDYIKEENFSFREEDISVNLAADTEKWYYDAKRLDSVIKAAKLHVSASK